MCCISPEKLGLFLLQPCSCLEEHVEPVLPGAAHARVSLIVLAILTVLVLTVLVLTVLTVLSVLTILILPVLRIRVLCLSVLIRQ